MTGKNFKSKLELIMGVIMLTLIYICARQRKPDIMTFNQQKDNLSVLIDAGHGGNDPGKVSAQNDMEKQFNLEIALRLKRILESNDMEAYMTRTEDCGLYKDDDSNKKQADMKRRVKLVEEYGTDILVSVHMNSYVDSSVSGAQVFYYSSSDQGKKLAESIQTEVSKVSILNNSRVAKKNSSYYILRKASVPAVIIECGFLSNPEETALLRSEKYQEQMAEAIYMGIRNYMKLLSR